eukprot:753343-Hanusia_phi.AAC.3
MPQSSEQLSPSSASGSCLHPHSSQMKLLEEFGSSMCVPTNKELFDDFFGPSPNVAAHRNSANLSLTRHGGGNVTAFDQDHHGFPNLDANGSFTSKKMFRRRSSSLTYQGLKISCDEVLKAARQDSRLSELLHELKHARLPSSLVPSIALSMRELTWDQFRLMYHQSRSVLEAENTPQQPQAEEHNRWPEQSQWVWSLQPLMAESNICHHPPQRRPHHIHASPEMIIHSLSAGNQLLLCAMRVR